MKLLIVLFLILVVLVSGCLNKTQNTDATANTVQAQPSTNITRYSQVDNGNSYFSRFGVSFIINNSWLAKETSTGVFFTLSNNPNVSIHFRQPLDFAGKSKNDVLASIQKSEEGNFSKILSNAPVIIGIGNLANVQSIEVVSEFFGLNETAKAKTTIIGDNNPIVIDYQVVGRDSLEADKIYKLYEEEAKKVIWSISVQV